jgi:hypothetical protein
MIGPSFFTHTSYNTFKGNTTINTTLDQGSSLNQYKPSISITAFESQ